MALPRASQIISELNKIIAREGDLPVSCDGFFGECAGTKLHVKYQTKHGHFWNTNIHPDSERGEKIIQLSHL